MDRTSMINRVGVNYLTSNIEGGEYSYVKEAGSKDKLIQLLGYEPKHYKLDIRFEDEDVVVLIETKQYFKDSDQEQLQEYLDEEKILHPNKKIICMLANTNNDKIKVWKTQIDNNHLLDNENVLDTMEHYKSLFELSKQNNREAVLKNTYSLNETLHKKDIDEKLRSQFVGTVLLYIQDILKQKGIIAINEDTRRELFEYWSGLTESQIIAGIKDTLTHLLDGSDNKTLKLELLQKNVLDDQKVKRLKTDDWAKILDEIVNNIYKYINTDSSEGQDILNLFFIAFNKYTGKADKNQAFTPDHITNFMCRITDVDRTKRVFDGTCGSGSFLVQAMVLELADCNNQRATDEEKQTMRRRVVKENIYGIELEEKAYGLSTTNMLIHGDGNSNIKKASIFESKDFIRKADPDIVLMNPPYNAKPISIPSDYKNGWKSDAKEDPTKGLVFLKYVSDVIKKMNKERIQNGESPKEVKCAILLPVSAAIGTSNFISDMKKEMLEDNRLEAVFTLPNEIFYPGASASACCMLFTLGKPHVNPDGTVKETFFGYYKDDGHKKKKNLGRIEQFDKDNNSVWKKIEEEWLNLYRNRIVKDGLSATAVVSGDDEWLCEAYMKTDYSKLCEANFQKTINNYCSYLVKVGKFPTLTLSDSVVPDFNVQDWREFRVGNLFNVSGSTTTSLEDLEYIGDGIYPYVTTSAEDNGVAGYYAKFTENGNIICIESACAGYATYQAEKFTASDHVEKCIPKFDMNCYIGMFIVTILNLEQYKYSYGRKCNQIRIRDRIIKLPVDANGNPDWQFMENYIKSLPYGDSI